MWIKSTLASAHLDQLQSAEHETLWVKVRLRGGTSLVIGSVYRPGSCSPTDLCLIDSLDDTLHQAKELSPKVILAGDFNVHSADWLGSAKSTPTGDALEDLCITHELTQHVREPTRGANPLDLIMSTFQQPISTTVLAPLGRSDHGTVIAQFPTISPCRGEATTRTVWRYERADWGRLRAHLKAVPWASIITDDPELSCLQVTNTIAAGMDQFIPHKTLVIRSSDPKWWTPECTQVMRIKDREWRKWRHDLGNDVKKQSFIDSVTRATTTLQHSGQEKERHLRARLTCGSLRDKAWWCNLKGACGLGRNSDIPLLLDNAGKEHITSKEKADCFGHFFAGKCSLGDRDLHRASLGTPAPAHPHPPLTHVHFRIQNVHRLLRRLDTSKATGPDSISPPPCPERMRFGTRTGPDQAVLIVLPAWIPTSGLEARQCCSCA